MRKYFAPLALLFFISTLWTTAQMVETRATMGISKDTMLIGDTVTLYIDIEKDMVQNIAIPDFTDGMLTDKIEIIEGPTIDTISEDNRAVHLRLSYVITAFDAGGYIMDSFPLMIGNAEPFDTLYARGSGLLAVGTFEIDTTKDAIADIKPIIATPYSWDEFVEDLKANWLLFSIIAILVAAIVIGVLWYLKRKRARLEALKALPPHVRALSSLENIRNQRLWQDGKVKEYYSEITDVLRTYMEERFGVYAMEMTSSEILAALKAMHTEAKLMSAMSSLFEISDLVKFAKVTPEGDECETAYFDAYYYIEQTKPVEIIVPNDDVDEAENTKTTKTEEAKDEK